MKNVEIKYNPYLIETFITVDGQIPKLNSSLNVGKKRLQEWVDRLPMILLDEYRDPNLKVSFQGSFSDYEDVRVSFEAFQEKVSAELTFTKTIDITDVENTIDAIFEEINNAIFRKGHINLGLSSAIAGSGTAYDFTWFKTNVMRTKTSGEDKELEALLLRQEIFIDYFDHIYVYGEKKRSTAKLNEQRGRWASQQLHNFIRNIRFLPGAIFRKQYGLADKIIQWMLIPRTTMMGIIMVMSIVLPFIYVTLVIKWWILGALALFIFALVTPDYLVEEMWDKTFLRSPFVSLWGLINVRLLGKHK